MTSLKPVLELNSGEWRAVRLPVSNCRYLTGVRVAGVETVGRPGFASGSSVCSWPSSNDAEQRTNTAGYDRIRRRTSSYFSRARLAQAELVGRLLKPSRHVD